MKGGESYQLPSYLYEQYYNLEFSAGWLICTGLCHFAQIKSWAVYDIKRLESLVFFKKVMWKDKKSLYEPFRHKIRVSKKVSACKHKTHNKKM